MLQTFLSVLFAFAADHSPDTSQSMQQTLIEAALTSPRSIEKGLWSFILGPKSTKADCCTWKVLDCEDGVAHAVLYYRFTHFFIFIAMEALPQTIRYIHLNCEMKDFHPRMLPRDLKYIYMRNTNVLNGNTPHGWPQKATHTLNTADFPSKLEEAILGFNSPLYKTVLMPSLPPNMRYFSISNMGHIQRLVVSNEALPECFVLCNVYLLSERGKADLIETQGRDIDKRVRSINMKSRTANRIQLKELRYYTPYMDKCRERYRGL